MAKANKKKRKLSSLAKIGLGEEKSNLIENLSMLIHSGMNILLALKSIKKDTRSKQMRKAIDWIAQDISEGLTVWEALNNSGLMSPHIISLIRVGEETGHLPENLKVIVDQQRKEKSFRSKVRSAMAYPLFVLFITLVVGTGITWFILPKLSSVFDRMDIELPAITKVMIAISKFLQANGIIAVPSVFLVLIILLYILFGFKKTKFIGQAMLLSLPGIKNLLREVELANFGFSLGTMLNAGLPIDYALKSLKHTTSLIKYKKMYATLAQNVSDGTSVHHSISSYPHSAKKIPSSMQQMVGVAEDSGHLPNTLIDIGKLYEEKLDNTTKSLTAIMEPAMLFIVWFFVVMVALGVIQPIYKLIGNVNQSQNQSVQSNETKK